MYSYLRQWGSQGSGDGQFNIPYGVAVAGSEVYVADYGNHRIQVFNAAGVFQRKWGSFGTGDGQFKNPADIAIANGEVYVTDYNNSRVQVFDTAGNFVRKWSMSGGAFTTPTGLTVYNGEVYVADIAQNRIDVYDINGVLQRYIGSSGSGDGQFSSPWGVVIAGDEVYVTDVDQNRVQVFNTAGTYQRQFGSAGSGDGQFNGPEGVAVRGSTLLVADSVNERVQAWTLAGSYLGSFSGMYIPRWLAVDGVQIYVTTDAPVDGVQVFGAYSQPSVARGLGGRYLIAHLDADALKLAQYDDLDPPTVSARITVESSGVTDCSLTERRDNSLDLLYVQGDVLKHRRSTDEGATWSAATTVYASTLGGLACHCNDIWGGIIGALAASANGDTWYLFSATYNGSGSLDWHVLAAGDAGESLSRPSILSDGAGNYELMHVQLSGDVEHIYGGNLWIESPSAAEVYTAVLAGGNYKHVAYWPDKGSGMRTLLLYQPSTGNWYVIVGTLNAAGTVWSYSSPVLVEAGADSPGDLVRRSDSIWEFTRIRPSDGEIGFLRCKNLATDGTGAWA